MQNVRVLSLCRLQQRAVTLDSLHVDFGLFEKELLDDILVLSMRADSVHEGCGLLLIGVVHDYSLLVQNELNELDVALLTS
jgi:hypothetical protein